MGRELKTSNTPRAASRTTSAVDATVAGDTAIVRVSGLIDERFAGFGEVTAIKSLVIDVSGMTRMTSFGVRQWIHAMDALPKSIADIYLLGCPTFFVDQLNMVLNFGGRSKVLTVMAPFTCRGCDNESSEIIDVLSERGTLAKGNVPEKSCSKCGERLEFDETPESYFSFVSKYAASSISPGAAQMLEQHQLYSSVEAVQETPPRIMKLVHGNVTYFRIGGTIGTMFRARPFLVGAEGEVVIDLAEVDRFDSAAQKEWRRLLKSLSTQVPAVTLVDVSAVFLSAAGDTLAMARNIAVSSVLVPYLCGECGRSTKESISLASATWPPTFVLAVCSRCGGTTSSQLTLQSLAPLQKASTVAPPASAKIIEHRDEILSRAVTDAKVAEAGQAATADVNADDTILGKYKIVRRLSEGGMAEVFLAKQLAMGGFEKPVALKRIQRKLLDSRHQAIELFLNEAKIAGRLQHPNIVQVLDVGEVGGALYLAMEYVNGKDLRNVVKKLRQTRTPMPLGEACFIVREVAQALDHAYWSTDIHGKRLNVVHRDVSPHNIILSYDGMVKLLDFGVAMSAVTEHAETMIVGKWLYMSPETTSNEPIDHRSDLFSLGVVLYLLCSGTMPFSGRQPSEIVRKIRAGNFKPLQEVATHVPEPLANLVHRMLASNPEDRPQRGNEVVKELADIQRLYGLAGSTTEIATFLSHVFPEDALPSDGEIKEIVRYYPEEVGSMTSKERSFSQTPSSATQSKSLSRSISAVDVSQTYQAAEGEWPSSGTPTPHPEPPLITVERPAEPPPPDIEVAPQLPMKPDRGNGLKIVLLLLVAVGAAVAMFFIVSNYL